MPIYQDDIKDKPLEAQIDTAELVRQLMQYTEPQYNPWRADYEKVIRECINFKELNQWEDLDGSKLSEYDVPPISVDRINRSLDTIDGYREEANNKKKIVKRESGDDRIAEILDKVGSFVDYNSNLEKHVDSAFQEVKDVGIGLTKLGWDTNLSNGEGDIFFENILVEDCGWSFTREKDFSDLRWVWRKVSMDWESAIRLNPFKAPELKSLKSTLVKRWEEIKGGNIGMPANRDYEGGYSDSPYAYPDQVNIWEFEVKRIVPYKMIAQQLPPMFDMNGMLIPQQPKIQKVPIDYEVREGEQEIRTGVDELWYQHIIATGKDKKGAILLSAPEGNLSEFPFCSFTPMVVEFLRSGRPRGFIEIAKDHQIRINLAWGEKTASNNASLKFAFGLKNGDPALIDSKIKQTVLGGVLFLGQNEEFIPPPQRNLNMQAIEEGNMAREDMDFAVSASEPVLRGQSSPGDSGVKVGKLQSAAITPLNKWVKAERAYKLNLWRKILHIIIKKYPPERLARIIGEQRFMELVGLTMINGQIIPLQQAMPMNPLTGKATPPPLQLPLQIDVAQYDVIIQDQSLSDFKKQQAFNASMAISQTYPLDAEYVIMHAPIDAPEEAYASHLKAKQDIINMMMQRIQMLEEELGQSKKGEGGSNPQSTKNKSKKSQPSNAQAGANASQVGIRSMIGGQLGMQT